MKVARADNQPQAEFIAGLLLEEGIPCLLRSSIAGYAPWSARATSSSPSPAPRPRAKRSPGTRPARAGLGSGEDGLAGRFAA